MKRKTNILDSVKLFFGFDTRDTLELKALYDDVDDSVIDLCVRRARRLQITQNDLEAFIKECIHNHVSSDEDQPT